jgi:hypothetical protein
MRCVVLIDAMSFVTSLQDDIKDGMRCVGLIDAMSFVTTLQDDYKT